MEKEHEFCLRCGRRLKTIENRIRGYGEICFKKRKSYEQAKLFVIKTKKEGIGYGK